MIAAIAIFAIVFAAGAVLFENSSGSDGATTTIQGDTNLVKTGGTLTYQIMYFESEDFTTLNITYTAVLNDSQGNAQAGAVSPSSGSLTNGENTALTITAPSTAGTYTLLVTFTGQKDSDPSVTSTKTQSIKVVEPIVLSAVLKNNSIVDFTNFAVYFKVDGVLIDDSKQLVTVTAGQTTTVTYSWTVESLSNGRHTFQVVAGNENIGSSTTSFMGGQGAFYVGNSDYGLVNVVLVLLLIFVIIGLIYFYRKPVKNYGKPKSRR